jgi:hypothetical protein
VRANERNSCAPHEILQHPAPWIGRFFADLERAELRNSTGGASAQ